MNIRKVEILVTHDEKGQEKQIRMTLRAGVNPGEDIRLMMVEREVLTEDRLPWPPVAFRLPGCGTQLRTVSIEHRHHYIPLEFEEL